MLFMLGLSNIFKRQNEESEVDIEYDTDDECQMVGEGDDVLDGDEDTDDKSDKNDSWLLKSLRR